MDGPESGSEAAHDYSSGARMNLTVAQALVRFLSVQSVERDGHEQDHDHGDEVTAMLMS